MVQIGNSERVTFVGATGSGKTEMAKSLLVGLDRSLIIDPKHRVRLYGYRMQQSLPIIATRFNIIVRPRRGAQGDLELADLLYDVLRRGNVITYVDELTSVVDAFPKATKALEEIARTGREPRVGLWTAMQRPRHVPLLFLTETEVFFVFTLRDEADRSHMAGFIGKEARDRIDNHHAWYIRPGMSSPDLVMLDIKRQVIEQVYTRPTDGANVPALREEAG